MLSVYAAPTTKQITEAQVLESRQMLRNAKNEATYSLLIFQYQVLLEVPKSGRVLLGRDIPHEEPAIDLTPYCAHENGVSRVHAALYRMGGVLAIADMGSSNGTFVNDQRVPAHMPRILRAGDIVRLGNLVFTIQES